MLKAVYVTFDELNPNSGAGLVCLHEISALRKVVDELDVIERKDIPGANKYDFNPFLYDYFTSQLIPAYGSLCDLMHLSCSPANAILTKVQPTRYCVNIVAHDLQVSIDEHELYYGKGSYPFKHNTDEYLHGLLLKHANYANCIFTPSSTSRDWIDKNIPDRKDVRVISHGTEIPETVQPLPENFTAGYLGAFGPDKGLGYMIEAWRQLPQAEFLLGGTCCNAINDQYLAPNMHKVGWLENVSDFYNRLSVYIQPSVTEGFGIEILEAMAHGRPIIASRGAGGADVISEGFDGFVVSPRNIDAIKSALQFFIENPVSMRLMGDRAREKAKQYSWSKIEEKYVQEYTRILGRNNNVR
jgi:glycosyltransferase involved in cell wall biosynthesis